MRGIEPLFQAWEARVLPLNHTRLRPTYLRRSPVAIKSSKTLGMGMYQEVTRGIRISVEPLYLADQSDPVQGHFVWAYQVTITNEGSETVQLMTRHWRITDSAGRTQEVRGPGVVGEQPILKPGDSYEYASGTPLSTPSGIMVGSYQMQCTGGETFDAQIPAFSLDSPHQPAALN